MNQEKYYQIVYTTLLHNIRNVSKEAIGAEPGQTATTEV